MSHVVIAPEDNPLRVETRNVDFKLINKTFVALKAELLKGFNSLLVVDSF
jgi:hypothetical protein